MIKQNQNGSAHVIIIIILIIAIIGALGFIVWKNYLQPKTDPETSQINTNAEPVVKSKTAQIDASFPADLSWTYPETWAMKSEGRGPKDVSDTTTQKFILTSPHGNYDVIHYVGYNGGLGGTCQPEGYTLQSVNRTPVPNFDKSVFMETITETIQGFKYNSSLFQNDTDTREAKKGDPFCKIYLKEIIPLTTDGKMVILAAEVNIKEFDSFDEYGPTEIYPSEISAIEKAFIDPEYKDAVKILLSTVSN
jgi:hypothetical protein